MFYKIKRVLTVSIALISLGSVACFSLAADNNLDTKTEREKKAMDDARKIVDRANANLARSNVQSQDNKSTLDTAKEIVEGANANLSKGRISDTQTPKSEAPLIDVDNMVNSAAKLSEESKYQDVLPELLVFISHSMPKQSISQLAKQVERAGGVLVFRGMHEGSLKTTFKKLRELNEQGVSAVIDPIAFSNYQVQVVPTFVLRSRANIAATSFIDRMEGNVTLEYVLERFANEGIQSSKAKMLLSKMQRRI